MGKGWELFFNDWRVLVGEDGKVLETDLVVVVAQLPWLCTSYCWTTHFKMVKMKRIWEK